MTTFSLVMPPHLHKLLSTGFCWIMKRLLVKKSMSQSLLFHFLLIFLRQTKLYFQVSRGWWNAIVMRFTLDFLLWQDALRMRCFSLSRRRFGENCLIGKVSFPLKVVRRFYWKLLFKVFLHMPWVALSFWCHSVIKLSLLWHAFGSDLLQITKTFIGFLEENLQIQTFWWNGVSFIYSLQPCDGSQSFFTHCLYFENKVFP